MITNDALTLWAQNQRRVPINPANTEVSWKTQVFLFFTAQWQMVGICLVGRKYLSPIERRVALSSLVIFLLSQVPSFLSQSGLCRSLRGTGCYSWAQAAGWFLKCLNLKPKELQKQKGLVDKIFFVVWFLPYTRRLTSKLPQKEFFLWIFLCSRQPKTNRNEAAWGILKSWEASWPGGWGYIQAGEQLDRWDGRQGLWLGTQGRVGSGKKSDQREPAG